MSSLAAASPDAVSVLAGTPDAASPPAGAPSDPLASFWDVLRASDRTYCGRYRCGQQWLVNVMLQPSPLDGGVLAPAVGDPFILSSSTPDVV